MEQDCFALQINDAHKLEEEITNVSKQSTQNNKHKLEVETLEAKIYSINSHNDLEIKRLNKAIQLTEQRSTTTMKETKEQIETLKDQLQSSKAQVFYTNSLLDEEQVNVEKLKVENSQARLQAHISKEKLLLSSNKNQKLYDERDNLAHSLAHSESKVEMLKVRVC